MSDQQLLELAALAVGMPAPYDEHGIFNAWVGDPVHGHWWNPLEDDGDALRLAMALELGVVCKRGSDPYEKNRSVATDPYRVDQLRIVEPHRGKPEYATRRAIVRAAAEIGKAMQEKN